MRKRSLEQIYAVLAAPCSTIPTPCTNPAALSATTEAFRVSGRTFCFTTLTFYATIAAVFRKFIKTTKFLILKARSALGIERGHSRTGSNGGKH